MDCPLKAIATEKLTAWIERGAAYSYGELNREAERLAEELHNLGVGEGDRIAVLHPTCFSLVALFFAVWRVGASICPLNARLPREQLPDILDRLSPKLFVSSFPISANCRPSKPSVARAAFLFTSGSTGRPKIAVLSFENLIANAAFSVPLTSSDRWLFSLPLFHVGGIGIMMRCVLAGAAMVLDERSEEITHLSYVPTQLYRSSPVYKNLKCLLLGGAPVSQFPERLPVYVTYGLTEMGSMVATRFRPPKIEGYFYLGKPLPGRAVSLSSEGEILVQGKTLFQGYWEKEGLQKPGEWFATKDLGRLDSEEGLAIVGRKDWQFISGGENIQPEEIEQVILQIPTILEAVVIPQNDAEFGQRPIAFVKAPFFDEKTTKEYLCKQLPKYKVPIAWIPIDEMPRIGFKIDRKKLFEIVNKIY